MFTVILGGIALADRHAAGDKALVGLLESMRMAAERGTWIVGQMLGGDTRLDVSTGHHDENHEENCREACCGAGQAPSHEGGGAKLPLAATRLSRILVVEDDSDVAEVAMAVLEGLGHLVDLAVNAKQALERLAANPYDLVFSDIVMPGGMSGIELAETIRSTYPALPVLLATGFSGAALGPAALRFPVLAKPYSVRELSSQTARLLASA